MRIPTVQSGPVVAVPASSPARPAAQMPAIPGDSVEISTTARQLSAAGDPPPVPSPSLGQTNSGLDDPFNQLEDRLTQRLKGIASENDYEVRKLAHMVQSRLASLGQPIKPATGGQSPPTAPPGPSLTTARPSPAPFDQLASALAQKVAIAENKIEQNINQSTAALQKLVNSPMPYKSNATPVLTSSSGQNASPQIDELEKLLTANISHFAQRMDTQLAGLEHSFMTRISAVQTQPGKTTPSDPLNELLNL